MNFSKKWWGIFLLANVFMLQANLLIAQVILDKTETIKLDYNLLAITKKMVDQKDVSVLPAYNQLLLKANKLLTYSPVSVMDKTDLPPSGSKHDYVSLAPYWWPNPATSNGLPYIKKDGQINPETKNFPDKENMPRLCENVNLLSIAYYLSKEEKYAKKASELLSVWFLDTATCMNPNLKYAQVVKGINNGRGFGIIDTRHFIYAIDGIKLLNGSQSWTTKKNNETKKWFATFLNWLQTSENGLEEFATKNNHGVWYDAQCLSLAIYVDSIQLAKKIIDRTLVRLNQQTNEDELFPLELERTNSLHYSIYNLNAFNVVAQLGEEININIWDKETTNGHSIKKCFYAVLPYLTQEKKWTRQEISPFRAEEGFYLLLRAHQKYTCTNCMTSIQQIAGSNYSKLLLQLL